jgi:heme oxygenase (biliverdin-producing, ferredoxin)
MPSKEEDTLTGMVAKGEGCPYAGALHSDDSVGDASSDTLLLSCPAFQKGSCPFASCQSDEEIRKMLLQIPSSHYEDTTKDPIGTQFLRVLQELHSVAPSIGGSIAQCPVASSKIPLQKKLSSFTQAIEGQSLAEIMARMAQDEEEQARDKDERRSKLPLELKGSAVAGVVSEQLSVENDKSVEDGLTKTSAAIPLLSETIKRGTAESHAAAENVHFVKNFIRGKVDRVLFAELVQKLYHVYRSLEELLMKHQENAALQPFHAFHVALQRTDSLMEDLDFWFGPAEAERIMSGSNSLPSPATQDYLDRLQYCAQHQPELLLAHSYTRYLGDLSGGAILARVARKALQLEGGDGLAFYDFKQTISNPKDFKNQYRRALDEWTAAAPVEALVHEANIAFGLNMRLFEELDVQAGVPGATLRPLEAVLLPPRSPVLAAAADAECPFARIAKEQPSAKAAHGCPWPFVLLHDPVRGMCDWRSWAVLGLLLVLLWKQYVTMTMSYQ